MTDNGISEAHQTALLSKAEILELFAPDKFVKTQVPVFLTLERFVRGDCIPHYQFFQKEGCILYKGSFKRSRRHILKIIRPDQWGDHQKKYTREILEGVDIISFSVQLGMPNKGCSMNHLDGSFGYVTIGDAMAKNWRVFDYETDALLGEYQTLDALIEGGWKVST